MIRHKKKRRGNKTKKRKQNKRYWLHLTQNRTNSRGTSLTCIQHKAWQSVHFHTFSCTLLLQLRRRAAIVVTKKSSTNLYVRECHVMSFRVNTVMRSATVYCKYVPKTSKNAAALKTLNLFAKRVLNRSLQ